MDNDTLGILIKEIQENRSEIRKINGRFSKYDVRLAVLAVVMIALAGEKLGLSKLIF